MRPTIRKRWPLVTAAVATTSSVIIATLALVPSAQATNACPPDFAFVNDVSATSNIGIALNCGTTVQQLTNNTDYTQGVADPAMSPDGGYVAFYRGAGSASASGTYIVPRGGGTPTKVSDLDGAQRPAWSPDSNQLAVSALVDSGGFVSFHIFKFSLSGGGTTQLTDSSGSEFDPAWCHNGRIAYSTSDGINIINASDGGGLTQVLSGQPLLVAGLAWSPDCQYVFYSNADSSTQTNIYVVPAAGGQPVKLTNDGISDQPTVSADWTLAMRKPDGIYVQWLGSTQASRALAAASGGSVRAPSFAPGDGSIPPPAGFPIPAGTTPNPPPTPECPTVFIGVRGSGETEADSGGLGSTIQTVANTFASVHPRTRIEHVNYMAVGVGYGGPEYGKLYDVSVDDGRTVLKAKISKLLRDCATSKLVLAGFSQGAHVVGDVFQGLKSSSRSHVAAVILIGDPRFNKKQKDGVNVGDFQALNGVYDVTNKVRTISGYDLTSRVRSYCTAGDPVCNFWLPDAVSCGLNRELRTASCPHVHYVERGWADKAALWAAGKIIP